MNDVDSPPPRPGVGPPKYKAYGGTDCSQSLKGPAPLEPRGRDRLPARSSAARLPPALGPNDAAARGQLGPAPERPSRRAGRLRPPRGAPSGAREPPWDHHSPLGRDQRARRGNGDS